MLGRQSRHVAAALSLIAAFALSACGGDSSDVATEPTKNEDREVEAVQESPDASLERPFEGGFRGSSVTTESTIPADTEYVGEEIEVGFFLTCADDACAQVYQRSHVATAREGGTWLFERDGDVLVARDVRTGPCEGDEEGEYRQVLDWTWNVEEDGSMTGQLDQQFTGCERDATSTTETRMDGEPADEKEPDYYLQGQELDELAAAISSYDEAFAVVNGRYQECETKLNGAETATEGGQCFGELLDKWVPALHELDAFITAGPPESAIASCKSGWEAVPSAEEIVASAEQAREAFATVSEGGGSYDPAMGHLQEALGHNNEEFQPGLTLLAYACVSPTDTADLGDDGRLAIDTDGILVPHEEK